MSKDEKKELIELVKEAILASHQSKDKEVSGLFKEINDKIQILADNQEAIVENESNFQDFVREELSLIKERAVLWNLSSKGFLGMLGMTVIAVFTAIINLVIRQ